MITLFPTGKGIWVLKQLAHLLGDSLAAIMSEGADAELTQKLLGTAVEKLLMKLDSVDVEKLAKTMIEGYVLCDGKKVIFEAHFSGKYGELLKVLKEVANANYLNFFEDLTSLNTEGSPVGLAPSG